MPTVSFSLTGSADGKIVAAGTSWTGGNDLAVARFEPNGVPDLNFGTGGVVTTDFGHRDNAFALSLQPDGKIVVAGLSRKLYYPTDDLVLARYESSGTLDVSFDGDGMVTIVNPFGNAWAQSVVVQPDGKIVAGGTGESMGGYDFIVVRLKPDGSLDPTFGGGIVTTAIGPSARTDMVAALALQPDGGIIAAGLAQNTHDADFAVVRYQGLGCLASVQPTCRRPLLSGKAFLRLSRGSTSRRDQLEWKWRGGEMPVAALGDPVAKHSYAICLYEDSGSGGGLLYSAPLIAGGNCRAAKPCWKRNRDGSLRYLNPDRSPNGIARLLLQPSADGAGKIVAKGSGEKLSAEPTGFPALPITALPVRMQLQATNGECWEAEYSAGGLLKNEPTQFRGVAE